MLAAALCRLAADTPRTSPHNMPQVARALRRTLLARNAAYVPHVRALSRALASLVHAHRSYATTTRATTASATKPTGTVKKAVKTAAAKKPVPKKSATTAKKAAPKTTAKKAVPKTAAKKKAKKPAAKKVAPKKRVKKPLTEEQKLKAKIRELRVKALREPVTLRPLSAANAFIAEMCSGKSDEQKTRVGATIKSYKNLTPAEHEHWNHVASEKSVARQAEYQAFIKSHTPEQIRIANNARSQLRRLLADKMKKFPAHTSKLVDDRIAKRPVTPLAAFVKDRHASGDFKNIKPTDALKLIAAEWKTLSAAEKQKYQDTYAAQRDTAAAA